MASELQDENEGEGEDEEEGDDDDDDEEEEEGENDPAARGAQGRISRVGARRSEDRSF